MDKLGELMDDFADWCGSIEPPWVGFVVMFGTVVITASVALLTFIAVVKVIGTWIFALMPVVYLGCLAYALYQKKGE